MQRDNGKVIFLQSLWWKALKFSAQAIGRWHKEIEDIRFDNIIEGETTIHKRYYNATSFKEHEAFLAGAEVEVKVLLPNGISPDDFKEILEVAGKYVGISPYEGRGNEFGRFTVVDVSPVIRNRGVHASNNSPVGSSSTDNPIV
jgi:hypothetical protein